jgi:hypothetical protein
MSKFAYPGSPLNFTSRPIINSEKK